MVKVALALGIALTISPVSASSALAGDIRCSVGHGRTEIVNGGSVTFFQHSNGSGLTEFRGTLRFGDGSAATFNLGNRVQHVFRSPGTYRVTISGTGTMTGTYSDGTVGSEPCTSSGLFSIVTVHELVPAVTATVSEDGMTVSLDASGSRDQRIISGYSWQFGDGTGASGPHATHRYAQPGRYQVRLTLSSPFGTASKTSSVTLQGPRPSDEEVARLDDAASRLPTDSPVRQARARGVPWGIILIAFGLTVAAILLMAFAPDPTNPLTYLPGGKVLKARFNLPLRRTPSVNPATGKTMPTRRAAAPGSMNVGGGSPPKGPDPGDVPKKNLDHDSIENVENRRNAGLPEKQAQEEWERRLREKKLEDLEKLDEQG